MAKIICDYCSEIRKLEVGFPSMEAYRRHLRTSGHEINYDVYMDLHTRGEGF